VAHLHVVRVFCAEDNTGGNPLGVFLDGADVPEDRRQAAARELAFAETVFVDDRERGEIRIFSPDMEVPLAGHPLVGTAWLMREEGAEPSMLRPPAGDVPVKFETELCFCAARPEWGPEFDFVEVESPQEVEALSRPPEGYENVVVWAWLNRDEGWIRARVFVPELGVGEDEATGSAALRLGAQLGHPIEIRQGKGSLIYARPADQEGLVEIGGRVVLDEVRDHPLLGLH
jgi:predicted PhzF superfamily epimerase YddE/YHI9